MSSQTKKIREKAYIENNLASEVLFYKYKNLALDLFEWQGLPDGIESRFIEKFLFGYGQVGFVYDKMLGYLVLPCDSSGYQNVYYEPTRFRLTGLNYSKMYNRDETAWVKNNESLLPTQRIIQFYTNKLYEIERTLDVHIKSLKTPYIITCSEKDLLTMKNLFYQIDGNLPTIFADKNLNLDSITVLQTKQEFIADRLNDYKKAVENSLLTELGINNANTDKKERLITDEVNANNENIQFNLEHMLKSRKLGCEEINEKFGLNVSVDIKNKQEVEEPKEIEDEPKAKEGEE